MVRTCFRVCVALLALAVLQPVASMAQMGMPGSNGMPLPLQAQGRMQYPDFSAFACRRNIQVSNDSDLDAAVAAANPGDCIVLADGSYSGFTITRSGSFFAPITIRAAHQGQATIASGIIYFNGVSFVDVEGVNITTPGGPIPTTTSNQVAVAFTNANFSRISRSTFRLVNPPQHVAWVWLDGSSNGNRIDHNEFGPYPGDRHQTFIYPAGYVTIPGVTPPADRTSWATGHSPYNPNMARFTMIDHNYFHDKASGSAETIVLGGIGVTGDYQDTFTTVENNLFVNCDGDAEIISVKSSRNLILHNTVVTSGGVLSARSGNGNVFAWNFVLAGHKPGSLGIKLNERDQVVFNNYIENTDQYPIMLENGDPYDSPSFGHAQVVNAHIMYNTFVNPGRQVLIGHTSTRPLKPLNTVLANNITVGAGKLFSDDNSVNSTYSQNIMYPYNPNRAGFTVEDPQLVTVDGLQKLSATSPAIGFANPEYYPYVFDDMDGQRRGEHPDAGADQYSQEPIHLRPLTPTDVGPNSR